MDKAIHVSGKKIFVTLTCIAIILGGIFLLDITESFSFEYVNTKEALIRYTVYCQNLELDADDYGGFGYLRTTYQAVKLLEQLNALDRINISALITFLNASTHPFINREDFYDGDPYNAYFVLSILKAINRMDLADPLLNLTALHQIILRPPAFEYASYVPVADFLGWLDDLNKTFYAENIYGDIKRAIYPASGYSSTQYNIFNWACYEIRALSILGGASICVSDLQELNEFIYALKYFLLMRWDAYNGGFDSYPWGGLSTRNDRSATDSG